MKDTLQSINKYAPALWGGLAFLLVMLVLSAVGEPFTLLLRYSRPELEGMQLWRVLSAHAVHSNLTHALMNSAGLFLGAILVGSQLSGRQWCLAGGGVAVFISLALYWFSPLTEWYVGFSGVLHGLLVLGLSLSAKRGERLHGVAVVLLIGKVAWEQLPGFDVDHLQGYIDAAVVVDAHLYGLLSGLLLALVYCIPWPTWRS